MMTGTFLRDRLITDPKKAPRIGRFADQPNSQQSAESQESGHTFASEEYDVEKILDSKVDDVDGHIRCQLKWTGKFLLSCLFSLVPSF